jgi:all-trans-retinol 13,14-reductase
MSILSYKKQKPEGKFDTIVIGSGPGGLAAAAILAKEGNRVLVLERHYEPGGFTHTFKRNDYEWDVGIHYLGSDFNRKGSFLYALLTYITQTPIQWEDMGEVYDRIKIGNKEFHFVRGKEAFKEKMIAYFPNESMAINKYIDLVHQVEKSSKLYYAEKLLPNLLAKIIGGFMRKKFVNFSKKTTLEVLKSLTKDEMLVAVLSGQFGDYGLSPSQSSFAMHAMLFKHYLYGACYPVGGASVIAEEAAKVIASTGGAVYTNAEVKEVVLEEKKAIGVKMLNGEIIYAQNIISNTGFTNTYTKLFSESDRDKHKLQNQIPSCGASIAHMSLYIGLKQTAAELNFPKANYWLYNSPDFDNAMETYSKDPINADIPVVYISYPSAKDPNFNKKHPGKATMEIVTLAFYDLFSAWENKKWKKRGEDYESLKEKFAQKLLKKLYEVHPELEGKIDYYELSTPITTKHFSNYLTGEIYGLSHTPERFGERNLKPETPIQNFYMTGQDIVSCGFAGALIGGVLTASKIGGISIGKKIIKGNSAS